MTKYKTDEERREAKNAAQRRYYASNREAALDDGRQYYARNREAILEKARSPENLAKKKAYNRKRSTSGGGLDNLVAFHSRAARYD